MPSSVCFPWRCLSCQKLIYIYIYISFFLSLCVCSRAAAPFVTLLLSPSLSLHHKRRTGSSSPLGMIFDHGCDALNSPIGSVNWCVAMGVTMSTPFLIFWTLLSSALPFYISTWEEYYTGALDLPLVNGPSEGLLVGASLSIASFLYGPQHWHAYSFWDTYIPLLPQALNPLVMGTAKFVSFWFNPNYDPLKFRGLCNYELIVG